ncbi:MAG: (2Fe-2S)-binding protein [Phycisphaeraceae bacterium]
MVQFVDREAMMKQPDAGPTNPGQTPPDESRGVSRRGFIKGVGGAVGAVALGASTVKAEDAARPTGPIRKNGLTTYPAQGVDITLNVNGKDVKLHVQPCDTLLEVLREQAGLTGCKEVCSRGACGACTVLLDGRSVNSCLTLAIDAVGKRVTTVEGLAHDDQLDPVQQAFVDHDACQCGYCIPGFVVRSRALLDEFPNADAQQIREGLCGNICRCAAYVRIFEAVESAAKGGQP